MTDPRQSIIAERGAQMFPTLTAAELDRLKRFGTCRRFAKGEYLARTGEPAHGLVLILAGQVEVVQQQAPGCEPVHIVTHEAGSFMGELAQLSGRPSLVNGVALTRGGGGDRPAGPASRPARRRGRAWRADHARPDPAPRRPDRERRRRAPDRRPCRRRRRAPAGQLPRPQRPSLSAARPGRRSLRAGARRTIPRDAGGIADRALPERQAAPQSGGEPAGALPRPGRAARHRGALRRGGGRRRAGGAGDLRLCGLGGAQGADPRLPLLRRPGRRLLQNRELSRLPDRHFRHGADGPGVQPGAEIRCRDGDPGRGGDAGMRDGPASPAARRRASGSAPAPR